MVDIKSIHRSYLIIIKVLLIVNIELTQYLRLHKFDQYCTVQYRSMFHWFTGLFFGTFMSVFFSLYFLNLSKYCVESIYMYMVLMEAHVFFFFFCFFFLFCFFF